MLKRNKLSIFLLAVVAMLTVYYVKNDKKDDSNSVSNSGENVRYYQESRDSINEARASLILELESVIASDCEVSVKQGALETMESITTITEKEIAMEYNIINMGYDDALVEVSTEGKKISICVLADEITDDEFISITVSALSAFDTGYVVDITNNPLP